MSPLSQDFSWLKTHYITSNTRGSVGWACVAHLSFCFEQTLYRTLHRCFLPSFGSFGQAVSEEKIFKNRPIRNKNCLWRLCLLMDRDKMSNLYRGPSIDASYQVSVYLAKGFQRRRLKCEKLTDDGRQVMAKAHIWQGDLKRYEIPVHLWYK